MELKKLNLQDPLPAATESSKSSPESAKVTPVVKPMNSAEEKPMLAPKTPRRFNLRLSRPAKIALAILGLLLVLMVITGVQAFMVMTPARATFNSARAAATAMQNQDLVAMEQELNNTKENLNQTQARYRLLGWWKFIPLARNYYLDGEHGIQGGIYALDGASALVEAIKPNADLLGFKAEKDGETAQVQSAEERLLFLTQTLEAVSPQLDEVATHLDKAKNEINQINPNRYPKSIAGKEIRANIIKLQDSLNAAVVAVSEAQPFIKLLPDLLGQNEPRTFMLLFQNDGELRPTGGFMTAYAYVQVDKGKITPLDSYDIYDLDARWGRTIPAPEPIKKYLPLVNNWNLRDMNLSPDFRVSMDTFYEHYLQIPSIRKVDGIIALDTQVPVELLKVLGPIGVGGWGNFSAENDERCDCPQVVFALENITTRPTNYIREERKAVLGPLMHSIVANAMGAPKSQWPQLLNVGLSAIKEKHLLFYFPDREENQASAEAFAAAGRILPFEGDYLHINDTNFAGAKSDLFIERSVEQEINLASDGTVEKTVTITYNNPHPPSDCNLERGGLCLNGIYRDWLRLYVPKGSELVEVVGSEVAAVTGEDLDKTVFEAFFTLRPQSSSKIVFTYKLPGTYQTPLPLLIQKQPGLPNITHNIVFNGQPQEVSVEGDLKLELR